MKSLPIRRTSRSVVEAMRRAGRDFAEPRQPLSTVEEKQPISGLSRHPVESHDARHSFYLIPSLHRVALKRSQAHATPDVGVSNPPEQLSLCQMIAAAQEDFQSSRRFFQEAVAKESEKLNTQAKLGPNNSELMNSLQGEELLVSRSASPSDDDANQRDALFCLRDALLGYSPTIDPHLVQRIAAAMSVADTLRRTARTFLPYLQDCQSELTPHSTDDDHLRVVHRVMQLFDSATASESFSTLAWAMSSHARLQAGIAVRCQTTVTKSAQRRRGRGLLRCFVRYPSDVQINEVLPTGAVVSLTHITLPDEVRSGHEVIESMAWGGASSPTPTSFHASLDDCLTKLLQHTTPEAAVVFLNFVLFKESTSITDALERIALASRSGVAVADIIPGSVVEEGDAECVTVQLCTLRVQLPPTNNMGDAEAIEMLRAYCLDKAGALTHVNLTAAPVVLQLVSWSLLPKGRQANGTPDGILSSQFQYAILLRGLAHRGGPAVQFEGLAQACAALIPNFYPPSHFGPGTSPVIRTYHIAAAVDQNRYAEATIMLLYMEWCTTRQFGTAAWLRSAARLLLSGEERVGIWRSWWQHSVPMELQHRIGNAKRDVLWNTLASCRLQVLAHESGGDRTALLASTPETGDFVKKDRLSVGTNPEQLKSGVELLGSQICPIYDQSDAAPYSVQDIVIPCLRGSSSSSALRRENCSGVVRHLEHLLGLTHKLQGRVKKKGSRHESDVVHATSTTFRPLFVAATGYPRAERPWSRSFREPASHLDDGEKNTIYRLKTDLDLTGVAAANPYMAKRLDYTTKSRGPKACVWALSKRGRAFPDRLPVGLLAANASAEGSLRSSSSALPCGGTTTRCLAIHCTLPAAVSLTTFLGEFTKVDDLRDPR